MNSSITLFSYYRSSASYRVRIALNLKKLDYQISTINLTKNGGENWSKEYLAINPQGFVPTLLDEDVTISQSIAIIEYLHEKYSGARLLPENINQRALSRALAQLISNDIHPLNNLRVLDYLKSDLRCNSENIDNWYCHWITEGLAAVEILLQKRPIQLQYCYSDFPSIADICLIPQLYNAKRFHCSLSDYPILNQIEQQCNELDAFIAAAPEKHTEF